MKRPKRAVKTSESLARRNRSALITLLRKYRKRMPKILARTEIKSNFWKVKKEMNLRFKLWGEQEKVAAWNMSRASCKVDSFGNVCGHLPSESGFTAHIRRNDKTKNTIVYTNKRSAEKDANYWGRRRIGGELSGSRLKNPGDFLVCAAVRFNLFRALLCQVAPRAAICMALINMQTLRQSLGRDRCDGNPVYWLEAVGLDRFGEREGRRADSVY